MYETKTGRYDEIPDGMKRYINNYGCHFNKKLYEEAVSRMYKEVNDKKIAMKPHTKEHTEELLRNFGLRLENNKLYDATYVHSMCEADYLGKSVPDEAHMAMFIKDTVDDADAESGFIFNRWYADQMFMNKPIDWEEYV